MLKIGSSVIPSANTHIPPQESGKKLSGPGYYCLKFNHVIKVNIDDSYCVQNTTDRLKKNGMPEDLKNRQIIHYVNATKYHCDSCKYMSKEKVAMEEHVTAMHKETDTSFDCTLCKKVCVTKSGLRSHFYKKHAPHKYKCIFCDFSASQLSGVKQHLMAKKYLVQGVTKENVEDYIARIGSVPEETFDAGSPAVKKKRFTGPSVQTAAVAYWLDA